MTGQTHTHTHTVLSFFELDPIPLCPDPSYLRPTAAPCRTPLSVPRTILILALYCSKPGTKTKNVELGRRG